MIAENIAGFIKSNLSIEEAVASSKPLILFIIGMFLYSLFIFKFYRFLATRDIFKLNLAQYSKSKWETLEDIIAFGFYILEHLIIFPLFVFFWFLVLSVFIAMLSREQNINLILTISMTVVATVRIATYYSEELAREIAKTLPLALLGIFIVSGLSSFNIENITVIITALSIKWKTILYYLLFTVCVEFFLRILLFIYNIFKSKNLN